MQGFGAKFGADYINQFGVCRGIGIFQKLKITNELMSKYFFMLK